MTEKSLGQVAERAFTASLIADPEDASSLKQERAWQAAAEAVVDVYEQDVRPGRAYYTPEGVAVIEAAKAWAKADRNSRAESDDVLLDALDALEAAEGEK